MGAVKGVVLFTGERYVRVRTAHRNEYNLSTDKDVRSGEEVWVFFDSNSVIKDIVPTRTLDENEIPPPDIDEPEPIPDLDLWDSWGCCSPDS